MTKAITIKIHAEVPAGVDPKFTAYQVLQQMTVRSDTLDSWQEINAPIGDETIGECHFEITEEDEPEAFGLKKFKVYLERTDVFSIEVEAENADEACENAREAMCQLDNTGDQMDSSSGFDVTEVEELV